MIRRALFLRGTGLAFVSEVYHAPHRFFILGSRGTIVTGIHSASHDVTTRLTRPLSELSNSLGVTVFRTPASLGCL